MEKRSRSKNASSVVPHRRKKSYVRSLIDEQKMSASGVFDFSYSCMPPAPVVVSSAPLPHYHHGDIPALSSPASYPALPFFSSHHDYSPSPHDSRHKHCRNASPDARTVLLPTTTGHPSPSAGRPRSPVYIFLPANRSTSLPRGSLDIPWLSLPPPRHSPPALPVPFVKNKIDNKTSIEANDFKSYSLTSVTYI
jgi:hypothetical protein